jgi:uncharacterized protein YjbI with pentapeptide repeats
MTKPSHPVSERELTTRWSREPGKTILQRINQFCGGLQMPGHGHKSEEIFAMLEGLPYREQVPNGRDLRGASLGGGIHELDLSEWDFSRARIQLNFVNCTLVGAIFSGASFGSNVILKRLSRATFEGATLTSCFFQEAQADHCNFDRAVLKGANFERAELTGSSFREANCKRAKFLRANLTGCNFQKALLDEAVFQDVKLDKTTDLRGASLLNLYHEELRDRAGNLVARGTDWRQATFDAGTVAGPDPAASAIELLDSAIALAGETPEPDRSKLNRLLTEAKENLRTQYKEGWYEDLLKQAGADQRPLENLLSEAMRNLM